MNRKKRLCKGFLSLAFVILSLQMSAQMPPKWYDLSSRNMYYPSTEYFVGYSVDVRNPYIALDAQTKKVADAARLELMSTIRVKVESVTTDNMVSASMQSSQGWSEDIKQIFEVQTKTSVNMEVPGVKIETWHNASENEVTAFAYVRRSDLINHFDKQITVGLIKIESALQNVEQLKSFGQKTQARSKAEETVKLVTDVEQAQRMLVAVDNTADAAKVQASELATLKSRLVHKLAELQHGLAICLTCTADCFGTPYSSLLGEIKGELSKLGCSFVSDPAMADYVVNIQAQAREYNRAEFGGYATYFAYVDANISLTKTATAQLIYDDFLSVKGGHTHNFTQAARDAYKDLSKEIDKLLKQYIK